MSEEQDYTAIAQEMIAKLTEERVSTLEKWKQKDGDYAVEDAAAKILELNRLIEAVKEAGKPVPQARAITRSVKGHY